MDSRHDNAANDRANDDLENLLRSTQIATIFLDEELRVRKFTPATTKLYDLKPSDHGRSIHEITPHAENMPPLPLPSTLDKLETEDHTVLANDGRAYLRRVLRYTTRDSRPDGLVVTFTDITELQESELRLAQALDATSDGAWDWNIQTGEVVFSQLWLESLGYDVDDIQSIDQTSSPSTVLLNAPAIPRTTVRAGIEFWDSLVHPDDINHFRETRRKHFAGETETFICEHRLRNRSGKYRWNVVRGQIIERDSQGRPKRMVGTDTDITDRYESQKLIEESQKRLRLALDAAEMGSFSWNRETDVLHLDLKLCEIWGLDGQTDQVGATCFQAIHHEDLQTVTKAIDVSFQNRAQYDAVFRIIRPCDGEIKVIGANGQWVADDDGVARRLVGLNWDMTEERRRQDELLQSRRQLELGLQVARLCLAEVNYDTGEVYLSAEAANLYGLGNEAVTKSREELHSVFHPDDREEVISQLEQCLDPEEDSSFFAEHRILLPNKRIRWVEVQKKIIFHPSPDHHRPHRAIIAARNVTKRKKSEIAMQLNEERLRLATSAAGVATFFVDASSNEINWSSEIKEIVGPTTDVRLVSDLHDVPTWIHPEDRQLVVEFFERISSDLEQPDHELSHRIVRDDGCIRYVHLQTRTIFEGVRKRVNLIAGAISDVTRQYEHEQQLEQAREAAVLASEQKSAFVANLSHEIRTPMTAILGYADLIREQTTDRELLEHLNTIRRNGDYLLEIINDILDLSKIESGKFEITKEPFNPVRLIEDVRSIMEVRATENNLKLTVRYKSKLPKQVRSDPKRIKQILINLVGNGIKFTPQGSVEIHVSYDDKMRFEIVDNGIGMSEEQMSRLFQPFQQGDSSVSRHFGGTGLGLAISRRLAKMLDGEITVESELHQGSKFTVEIDVDSEEGLVQPNPVAEKQPQAHKASKELDLDRHILVVDDRRDIRFLSKRLLVNAGARVDEAEDGLQAVEFVQAAIQAGSPPDLIVLDMQMPNLDGYQAASRIRDLGFTGPIIALTADAMQGDMNKCLNAGCNDYLAKPINAPKMLDMIKTMLS